MLSAIVAIVAAAPSGLHYASHYDAPLAYETVVAVEPEYHHVGDVVEHIPTAVSHQSRTDYHSKPIVKSILAPVEYLQPIVHHAPIAYHSLPSYHHHYASEPLIHHSW